MRAFRKDHRGKGGNDSLNRSLVPCNRVLVSNATGSSLLVYSTVKLGASLIDVTSAPGEAERTPCFSGGTPTSSTSAFGILLEPLSVPVSGGDASVVYAAVSGVTIAYVSVSDITHTYAAPANGSTSLASATSGPAKLLATPTSTGAQLMPVLLQGDMGTSSSSSLYSDYHEAASADTPSVDSTWEDSSLGADVTLSTAGYYLLVGNIGFNGKVSGSIGSTAPFIAARMYDVGAAVGIDSSVIAATVPASGTLVNETRAFSCVYYTASATTLRLQKYRSSPGTATWVTDSIGEASLGGATSSAQWGAVRLVQL